jgi:hypothetical protein
MILESLWGREPFRNTVILFRSEKVLMKNWSCGFGFISPPI